jgi:hypothetical protein
MPEARGRERLVETFLDEAQAKKIVGKDASLREAIAALVNFEIHPAVMITALEIVFLDELLRDVRHFDADIFWVRHGHVKVEVLEINGAKAGALSRENAVQQKFDQLNHHCHQLSAGCCVPPSNGSHLRQRVCPSLYFLMWHNLIAPRKRALTTVSMNPPPALNTCNSLMGSRGAMIWGHGGCFHGDVAKMLGGMAAPAHLVVVVVCRVLWVVFAGGTDF